MSIYVTCAFDGCMNTMNFAHADVEGYSGLHFAVKAAVVMHSRKRTRKRRNMSLFEHGSFVLHSGYKSDWRINCDDLTEPDLEVLASLIFDRVQPYAMAVCPPSHRGSAANKLVDILNARGRESGRSQSDAWDAERNRLRILIVDDVLTSGTSMEDKRRQLKDEYTVEGAVLFARGPVPSWISAIFRM